ncbi:hypothetical protein F4678DRAFT_456809 [Xylaria arbuscula]|nr:hypothetical protein F4678DRAFT_456809 [Xylaria arbuscula]
MGTYPKEQHHISRDPWLTIVETYSPCYMTYQTDRIAVISGLVTAKRISFNNSLGSTRNVLGLWESTLHIDLAWLAASRLIPKFLAEICLPSWTWMAYQESIVFTKDCRLRRSPEATLAPPKREFRLLNIGVEDTINTALPVAQSVSLTLETSIRKLFKVRERDPLKHY